MASIHIDDVYDEVSELRKAAEQALRGMHEMETAAELIVQIANGETKIEPGERDATLKMIDDVLRDLRAPLLGTMGGETLPDGFWLSELGQAIMRARVILSGDELITRAEAARRMYGEASKRNLMRVKHLSDAGRLTPYRDPSAEPSRSGLVSAREVKKLIDEGER